MVRKKSRLSWKTTPMLARSESRVTVRISIPSMSTRPCCGSYCRSRRPMTVLLPAPVSPTRATVWPGSTVKSIPSRALRPDS